MRTYYRVCGECGAHLDPGEKCDCVREGVAINAPQSRQNRAETHERGEAG